MVSSLKTTERVEEYMLRLVSMVVVMIVVKVKLVLVGRKLS